MTRILEIYLLLLFVLIRPIKKYMMHKLLGSYFSAIILLGLYFIIIFVLLSKQIPELGSYRVGVSVGISLLIIFNEIVFFRNMNILVKVIHREKYLKFTTIKFSSNIFLVLYIVLLLLIFVRPL